MPGTAVSIALNGPPLAWPGFGSNVSIWLGPPVIQSRMHAFLRVGSAAARPARRLDPARSRGGGHARRGQLQQLPARQFGRGSVRHRAAPGEARWRCRSGISAIAIRRSSVIQQELGPVQQGPEDVGEGLLRVVRSGRRVRRIAPGARPRRGAAFARGRRGRGPRSGRRCRGRGRRRRRRGSRPSPGWWRRRSILPFISERACRIDVWWSVGFSSLPANLSRNSARALSLPKT